MRFCGIQLRSFSQPVPKLLFCMMHLKIIRLKLLPNLPGFNEVTHSGYPWEKNWPPWLLTVTKMVTASHDWAVIWAVIELWPSGDHTEDAVIELWLSCDLAMTELWPCRDWAVTSPGRDWAVIIGPGAVTTVVTVSSQWAHGDNFFLMGKWHHMVTKIWVNIGSGNGLLPDGTKPLPEPMLTDHHLSPVAFILG